MLIERRPERGDLYVRGDLSAGERVKKARSLADVEHFMCERLVLGRIDASAECGQPYPIVTLEPLVVQIYGPPEAKVIAMPLLTPDRVQALSGVLYLRQDHYQSEVDRRRYAGGFAALPGEQRVIREGSGSSVLLGVQGDGQGAAKR